MHSIDALTRSLTAHATFRALLADPGAPSLYPQPYSTRQEIAAVQRLADAYDRGQHLLARLRGTAALVAYRGSSDWWRPGQGPGPLQRGYELYTEPAGYRVADATGTTIGAITDAHLRSSMRRGASRAEAIRSICTRLLRDARVATPRRRQLALEVRP